MTRGPSGQREGSAGTRTKRLSLLLATDAAGHASDGSLPLRRVSEAAASVRGEEQQSDPDVEFGSRWGSVVISPQQNSPLVVGRCSSIQQVRLPDLTAKSEQMLVLSEAAMEHPRVL